MTFIAKLDAALAEGAIDKTIYATFKELYESYKGSLEASGMEMDEPVFIELLTLVKEQLASPYKFEPFHERIRTPYDYFAFGKAFTRPLVIEEKSRVFHSENLDKIEQQIAAGDNVILLANHQTETDPQLMNLALEKTHPKLAEEMVFVAGHRVVTDPMAIPFSMGCNLLCIYSKRHIDNPPEHKEEKQRHNQRTMKKMKELLAEGGKCIYVAPSGGRDRPDENGNAVVSPFDPQSIEMFRLMARQAKRPAHFYPLALATYDILPPPLEVKTELGEERRTKREGIFFSFGDELDFATLPGADSKDKQEQRSLRAQHIWSLVNNEYHRIKP